MFEYLLGVAGAMILNTLLDELKRQEKRFNLATLCVGDGMDITTIIERINWPCRMSYR